MITEQDLQDTYIKFCTNFDLGTTFQDPATPPVVEAIIDLHHYITFYLVLVLAFVIVIFLDIFLTSKEMIIKALLNNKKKIIKILKEEKIIFLFRLFDFFWSYIATFIKEFRSFSIGETATFACISFQIFFISFIGICSLSEHVAYAQTTDSSELSSSTFNLALDLRAKEITIPLEQVVSSVRNSDGFLRKPSDLVNTQNFPFHRQLIDLTRLLAVNDHGQYLFQTNPYSKQYMLSFGRSLIMTLNDNGNDTNTIFDLFQICSAYVDKGDTPRVVTMISAALELDELFETQRVNMVELSYKSHFVEYVYKTYGTPAAYNRVITNNQQFSLICGENFKEFRNNLVDNSLALRSLQLKTTTAFVDYFSSIYELTEMSQASKEEIQTYIERHYMPQPEGQYIRTKGSYSTRMAFLVAANLYDYPDMYTDRIPSRTTLLLSERSISEPMSSEVAIIKKIAAQGFNPTKPISDKPLWRVTPKLAEKYYLYLFNINFFLC